MQYKSSLYNENTGKGDHHLYVPAIFKLNSFN